MGDGGKGSSPRPLAVPRDDFEDNYDRIFGKNKKVKNEFIESSDSNSDNSEQTPTDMY